jgi:hypothetical protein
MIARPTTTEGRKLRLALLTEYLTDDAVRDVDSDRRRFLSSSIAGYRFDRLEVRNFAALQLAEIFKFDDEPDRDWSAAQWTELRERVRAAVAKELGR